MNILTKDDDWVAALILRLRRDAEKKGFSKLAADSGMGREHLYIALSDGANPTLKSLVKIASGLGYQLDLKKISA